MSENKPPTISHPVGVLHEIRWNEICPWLILVRALRVSLLIRVLVLAYVGVLLTQVGWSVVENIFSETPIQLERLTENAPEISPLVVVENSWQWENPLIRAWRWLSNPIVQLTRRGHSWTSCLALVCCAIWALEVWALLGGAIARIAALQLTRGETIGPLTAFREAVSVFAGTTGAPIIPLLGAASISIPLVLAGLLIRFDIFVLLTGLVWVLVLALGLMLAVVLIGLLIGWPLMWATLAVERSDAFDAVSRSYAYVYQRPLQLTFYIFVAGVLGIFGDLVVSVFAYGAVQFSDWAVSWGAGEERMAHLSTLSDSGSMATLGAKVILFWKEVLLDIAAAYPVVYLWSAAVGIYLLLRRHVDATEMEEVVLTNEERLHGLPKIEKNETGIPKVKRDP